MATNLRKTVTDAGYITVGLAVLAVQQGQARGRELREHAAKSRACVTNRTHELQAKLETRTRTARDQAEAQVRTTVDRTRVTVNRTKDRTKELGSELGKRVEPVVGQVQSQFGQVQAQLGEIPERVVQAMEPVTARFRELAGNAA